MTVINGIDQAAVRQLVGEFGDYTPIPYDSSVSTLLAISNMSYQHVHQPAKVYPTLQDPIALAAAAGAWAAFPTPTEIIPANTITNAFDVHWVLCSDLSEVDYYELKLYTGGAGSEVEIGHIAFHRTSVFNQEGNLPIQVTRIAANSRISAAISCGTASATCGVKLYYHEYG